MTNNDIAKLLGISERSVVNKRNGHTQWTLPEYQLLVDTYGKTNAHKIVSNESIESIKAITSDKDVSID